MNDMISNLPSYRTGLDHRCLNLTEMRSRMLWTSKLSSDDA